MAAARLAVHPLTPERWPDVVELFGPRGACAGCWCMFWRRPRSEWTSGQSGGNRRAFRALVQAGPAPGLIAYAAEQPIGWCALAPRADYTSLTRSRVLAPVDDQPVWSVSCFFVQRGWRRRGVTPLLLAASARYAKRHGAKILEGYPIDTSGGTKAAAFLWTGTASAFQSAGFREVARRSPTRPIMRLDLTGRSRSSAPSASSSRLR